MAEETTSPGRHRQSGVTHEAIEQIRALIVSGEWGPGTRLPREVDLARQLGLSRNSLREAVRALSLARVLVVRQGDGTYVSSLEPGELLEPEAAALAALRGNADMLLDLRRELDRMLAAGDRAEELVDADTEFHNVIARAAGNGVLEALLCSLSTRTVRARLWHGLAHENALDLAREEHSRIYQAIASGDANLARAAMLLHIADKEAWLHAHLDPASDIPLRDVSAAAP